MCKTNSFHLKQMKILYMRTFVTIFREVDLIYDEQLHSTIHQMEIARGITRKIARQWFCNTINPFDLWLHDGLATLFGEEAVVKVLYLLISRKSFK